VVKDERKDLVELQPVCWSAPQNAEGLTRHFIICLRDPCTIPCA